MLYVFCRVFFIALSVSALSLSACAPPDKSAPRDPQDAAAAALAEKIVADMPDADLAAQVLLTGIDGSAALGPRSAELLSGLPAGGVMLFKYNLGRGAGAARRLTEEIRSAVRGPVPPFVAADQEGGSVHRFGEDATRLPPAARFGRVDRARVRSAAEEAAYRSGRELRSLGVTLNLAPVAEAADRESSAFLGDRSYGSDPDLVAEAASGFVAGMRRAGIACAVKHFPGNVAVDPHKSAAVLKASAGELEAYLKPFARVIAEARPAAVMVSHIVVASIDPDRPATLSPRVVEGLLRGRLGFRGLAVSDDLRMRAISSTGLSPEQAAPAAIAAGIDLVMTWPADAALLRDSLVSAVASGTLSRERLREAAARVVAVKARYGFLAAGTDAPAAADADKELADLRKATEDYLRAEGLR